MRIVTNNKPRPILNWWELSEKQQAFVKKEHDWLFEDDQRYDGACYIPFKGWIYLLSEFMTVEGIKGWDGVTPDTYFSGTVIKIMPDNENCIMGAYYG